jgi:hypothetical protein
MYILAKICDENCLGFVNKTFYDAELRAIMAL